MPTTAHLCVHTDPRPGHSPPQGREEPGPVRRPTLKKSASEEGCQERDLDLGSDLNHPLGTAVGQRWTPSLFTLFSSGRQAVGCEGLSASEPPSVGPVQGRQFEGEGDPPGLLCLNTWAQLLDLFGRSPAGGSGQPTPTTCLSSAFRCNVINGLMSLPASLPAVVGYTASKL